MAPVAVYEFGAMGGLGRVHLAGPRSSRTDSQAQAARDEVLRIEAKFSRYRDDSVVSAIAAAAGQHRVPCDEETRRLLGLAARLHQLSGGRFDATSGVYRRAWNFKSAAVPSERDLAELRPLVGWGRVEVDERGVFLPLAGMELDFGGFGKEYAADRAADVLRQQGVDSALVELGGDIVAIGPRPDGRPWSVGIRHPRQAGRLAATVPLQAGALATSGDYERYIEVNGQRYSHILDARTGWPVPCWQSASVIADNCLSAGCTTTLILLMGAEAPSWVQRHGIRGHFIDQDGKRLTSVEG